MGAKEKNVEKGKDLFLLFFFSPSIKDNSQYNLFLLIPGYLVKNLDSWYELPRHITKNLFLGSQFGSKINIS